MIILYRPFILNVYVKNLNVISNIDIIVGVFNKWGICSHVVAYSYAKALDWYGSQYRQPVNFLRNTKKGAKKRLANTGRFSLAEPSRVHSKLNLKILVCYTDKRYIITHNKYI
jgi:hypothetical protein